MTIIRRILKIKCVATLSCCFFIGLIFCLNVFAGDIVVFGDSQVDEAAQRRVVGAVTAFKPSIVFRLGDNVDNGNDTRQWHLFNDINKQLLETAEYFSALGNHEDESPLYFDNFPLLNRCRWYSVDRRDIHFIVLDSNSDLSPGSKQLNWLISDLNSVKEGIKYKIALFHHPLFDVGEHKEDELGLRPILLPLFQKYGIKTVFSGHDHNYQRFEYKGIYFIVTGGGGSNLYDQTRTSPYLKKFIKAYHFCLLSPEDGSLRIKIIDTDLRVIDAFSIPAQSKVINSRL